MEREAIAPVMLMLEILRRDQDAPRQHKQFHALADDRKKLFVESLVRAHRRALAPQAHDQVHDLQGDIGQRAGHDDNQSLGQKSLGLRRPLENGQSDVQENDERDDFHRAAQGFQHQIVKFALGFLRPTS